MDDFFDGDASGRHANENYTLRLCYDDIFSCLQPTLVDYNSLLPLPYLFVYLHCPRLGRMYLSETRSTVVAAGRTRTPAVRFYSRASSTLLSLLDNLHSESSEVFVETKARACDLEYDGSCV